MLFLADLPRTPPFRPEDPVRSVSPGSSHLPSDGALEVMDIPILSLGKSFLWFLLLQQS